jgi:CheY-like chemotaxis protein
MQKLVILVADDEPPVLDFIRNVLGTAGHTVLTAADGEEASCREARLALLQVTAC